MNQEKPSVETELTPEMRVSKCANLDELYQVIRDIGEVQGSKRVYTAEEVISAIQRAAGLQASGAKGVVERALTGVTNGLGIRDKARELIEQLPVMAQE
jgi:hypothetical protein